MSARPSPRNRRDDLVRAARDTSGPVDTPALEQALAAYREGAATWTEPEIVEVVTRRHRVIRALAATTVATKIVLGVATAAAVGGIGVAVTETVHHAPPPPVTTTSPRPAPTTGAPSTTTTSPSPTSSPSTVTASPTTSAPTPTGSVSPSRRPSTSPTPSRPRSTGSPSRTSPAPTPTRSSQDGQGQDDQGQDGDGQGQR